ncbi:MAG TPA: restriction endonuclease [Streptomyces sp.]|uniref:restriction endonuclease n=1 Tax=Streptomyces sp. TaxID=1931 RepID=UPI002D238A06|nr:restriction endonuclease [Streptomyces sp.]HZG04613.1 restriction endonuclease [Streptomyces sp.]
MAAPIRRTRPTDRGPAFDLRLTALAFGLAAIVLVGAGFAARTVAEAAGRHPVAAVALCLLAAPAAVGLLRGGRRFRAARAARRAAEALAEGAETALETLEETAPAGAGPATAPDREAPVGRAVPADPVDYADPADISDLVDYDAMDAEQFEQAVAALCERDGCRDVRVVGGAGDLGADVVATAPDGRRVVIQCKHYSDTNKVGSQDVQRFGGTCWSVHDAQVAAVVTTSDFTAPAAEYADRCGILCVDRRALLAWSDGTGPAPWAGPGADPARTGRPDAGGPGV